jgi:hypothetical protein
MGVWDGGVHRARDKVDAQCDGGACEEDCGGEAGECPDRVFVRVAFGIVDWEYYWE